MTENSTEKAKTFVVWNCKEILYILGKLGDSDNGWLLGKDVSVCFRDVTFKSLPILLWVALGTY